MANRCLARFPRVIFFRQRCARTSFEFNIGRGPVSKGLGGREVEFGLPFRPRCLGRFMAFASNRGRPGRFQKSPSTSSMKRTPSWPSVSYTGFRDFQKIDRRQRFSQNIPFCTDSSASAAVTTFGTNRSTVPKHRTTLIVRCGLPIKLILHPCLQNAQMPTHRCSRRRDVVSERRPRADVEE